MVEISPRVWLLCTTSIRSAASTSDSLRVSRMERLLETRTVTQIQSDPARIGRADDPAARASYREPVDPWCIIPQIGEHLAAVKSGGRHFCVTLRHDLEHRAHGIDDFPLRRGATARQIQHLGASELGAVGPGPFETAHTLDHQWSDRYESDNDQPGANAEKGIAAARLAGDVVGNAWQTLRE